MKPELGTHVYCIYEECILSQDVAFIGTESFLIESFSSGTNEDSWEWYYEDYNVNWFTDLEKAKEELRSLIIEEYNDDNFEIIQTYSDYYAIDWGDEE